MVNADDVLKLVLLLVALWIGLEILEAVVDITFAVFGALQPLLGLIIIVVIIAFLLDRI
ncbi:MAG: hypothetical protein U5K28_01025 [Halobacteriales archaeon]|nr:hypothetical protein [Halobacteriales archaeon]